MNTPDKKVCACGKSFDTSDEKGYTFHVCADKENTPNNTAGEEWENEFDELLDSKINEWYNRQLAADLKAFIRKTRQDAYIQGMNDTKHGCVDCALIEKDIQASIAEERQKVKRALFRYLFEENIVKDLEGRFPAPQYELIWGKIESRLTPSSDSNTKI